jgi:hypothetical protein
MIVSFLDQVQSNYFTQCKLSRADLTRRLLQHDTVVANTHLQRIKREQRAFIPAEFHDTSSKEPGNCKAVYALVLDIDIKARRLWRALRTGKRIFRKIHYAVYSSMNHLIDGKTPKLRIVLFYDVPLLPEQHRAVSMAFAAKFIETWGCEVDETSYNPVQCFTYGVRNAKSKPFTDEQPGPPLAVEPWLTKVAPLLQKRPEPENSEETVDDSQIKEWLDFVPAEKVGHDVRQRILKAIYATYGGAGHDLALNWYHVKDEDFELQWASARTVKNITAKTIRHYAIEHGWQPTALRLEGKGQVEAYAERNMADVLDNPHAAIIKKILGNYPHTARKLNMESDTRFDLEALKAHSKQLLHVEGWTLLEHMNADVKEKFVNWFAVYRAKCLDTVRIHNSRVTYLPAHVFQENDEIQAWVSPHGSGKSSELGLQILEWARRNGHPIVFVNDRQIATTKLAERLGIYSYDKVKKWRDRSKWESVSEVAVCVNSLAHPAFNSILARKPIIVIDEVAQVLSALQFGLFGDMGAAKVDEVTAAFVSAMCDAPRLVVMDANMTAFHIDILKEIMQLEQDIPVYSRELKPLKLNVEYGFDHGAQKKYKAEALRRLVENLQAGVKSMVPMESRKSVSELKLTVERYMTSKQAKKVGTKGEAGIMGTHKESLEIDLKLRIGAVTSHRNRDRDLLLATDVQKYFADLDAFLHTASVSSCVSNEVKEYTQAIAWFPGHLLTPTEMVQMLFRGRNVTNAMLALNTQYASRTFSYRQHEYSNEKGWAVRLHKKISRRLHEHRKAEQQDSLRTLLWFLEERGASIRHIDASAVDEYEKMLEGGKEEFIDQILEARFISEKEYGENHTRTFAGELSAFTDAEDRAYAIRQKFHLGNDDALTRGHILLEASMHDIGSIIDRCAAFLYEGQWKGFGRGAPPRDTDALLFALRPMKDLKAALSDDAIQVIENSMCEGQWLLDDTKEIVTAVMKNKKALTGNRLLAALVPDEFLGKAHNVILTQPEQQLVVKGFRTAFGLHVNNRDAKLIMDAARRRLAVFPDVC